MKALDRMGSSLEDLCEFPDDVKEFVGFALYEVQMGLKPRLAKPLTGIDTGIFEIVSDHDRSTYRVVYAVKLGSSIYVLHCFQKKSKHGIETPKSEIDLIKQRLRYAKLLAKERGDL